jgi:hypothetical protein
MNSFQSFFDGHGQQEEYCIYVMNYADQMLFGSASPMLWLSRISVEEHKSKHPEIQASDYFLIREMVQSGQIYCQGNKRFALLYQQGCLYRAAIKVTNDQQKMYLLTLFKTSEHKAMKEVVSKYERIK